MLTGPVPGATLAEPMADETRDRTTVAQPAQPPTVAALEAVAPLAILDALASPQEIARAEAEAALGRSLGRSTEAETLLRRARATLLAREGEHRWATRTAAAAFANLGTKEEHP